MSELEFLLTITIILLSLWCGYLAHLLNQKGVLHPLSEIWLKQTLYQGRCATILHEGINQAIGMIPNCVWQDPVQKHLEDVRTKFYQEKLDD